MEQRIDRSRSPAAAVRRAVADLEQCRPDQLGRLESVVDVDELNGIVEEAGHDDTRTIVFPYCGYLVAVRSDRTLTVVP